MLDVCLFVRNARLGIITAFGIFLVPEGSKQESKHGSSAEVSTVLMHSHDQMLEAFSFTFGI